MDPEEAIEHDEPTCLSDAKASQYWDSWKIALAAERSSLEKRGVFDECTKLPPGAKMLKAKIVYKQKRDKDGRVYRFKCRCTAKGYSQVELVHYYDTFAAVASGAYVRTCLSMGVAKKYKVKHLDVTTAFLYPELKEELYMLVPEDMARFPGEIVRLRHSRKNYTGL